MGKVEVDGRISKGRSMRKQVCTIQGSSGLDGAGMWQCVGLLT
jgi:hypothetical protein